MFQGERTTGAKVGNCETLWPGRSARTHGSDFRKFDVPVGMEWGINIGGQQELSHNTLEDPGSGANLALLSELLLFKAEHTPAC